MKSLSPDLQAHLESGATTLATCWKLTRKDATVLGFTDHDEQLSFGGITYEAVSGMTASAVESSLGLSVDNLDVIGALTSDRLNENDLAAGRYDDADVEIWRVNWQDVAQRVLLRKGNLGEVARGRSAFRAEVRGLAHKLNQTQGRIYQYTCDARVGDARCKVNLNQSAYKGTGAVAVAEDRRRFTATGLGAYTSDWFARGLVSFTSGANAGLDMEVRAHANTAGAVTIELWQSMPETLAPGDAFTITAGCDKTVATCKSKYANIENFRGFPLMPGNDFVTSYPTRTANHTGGSLKNRG